MIRLYTFFAALLGLIGTVLLLHAAVPPTDPFDDFSGYDRADLDGYRQPAIAAMKLRHAEHERPFDITIFGNSRSLRVTREYLGYPGCSFFNFSLQGSSYRNSVALLEALARHQRAPGLAIISMDNFAIQLATNPMEIPLAARWRSAAADWWAALSLSGVSTGDRMRMIVRTLIAEGQALREIFKFDLLRRLARDLKRRATGDDALRPEGDEGYRPDGSRFRPLPVQDADVQPFEAQNVRSLLPAYLRFDMQRLAALQALGTRIMVYESPLKGVTGGTSVADQTRGEFLALCKSLGIACAPAPDKLPAPVKPWFDPDHAHPETLSNYIRNLLAPHPPACAARS